MTTRTIESDSTASQGETCPFPPPPQGGQPEHQRSRAGNTVFKSGPLFISSKGIGWTSWKKRWFILTRTSLVFFRSDPNAIPQKSGEVNLTLGGIDLNNSGSVEVKPDRKLLTVLFPDGRDGRAFTLKAENLEDLYEWKAALESALVQAPSATLALGQNGILKNDLADAVSGSSDQQKDRLPIKSMVIGRPILLALEDIDGSPSFLEKALRFIEEKGVEVEGILRQAADVEEVDRRVCEYQQGKTEFLPEEDAHVVADCVKHVLRELPSSPVPASCCHALLEAFRTEHNSRVNAMRTAILETFPEPNRRLLQRILRMMQAVASRKAENRMSTSAVAACMAPLLLRPLLSGDCEDKHHLDVAGDGSFQLLQAAAAANNAQAIIITLLDEYENIFGEGSVSPVLFSDSEESGSETDEGTDDEEMYEDDDHNEYGTEECGGETDDEYEHSVSKTGTVDGTDDDDHSYDDKRNTELSESPERDDHDEDIQRSSSASSLTLTPRHDDMQSAEDAIKRDHSNLVAKVKESSELNVKVPKETSMVNESDFHGPPLTQKSASKFYGQIIRRPRWGRTSAQKNLSMESIDFSLDDEDEIIRLEAAKSDLRNQIAEEANGNVILQASLEKRKKALHERRLALEKDVARLREQLQKERDLRAALENGLGISQVFVSASIDERTKTQLQEIALAEEDLNNLKQRVDDLGLQLNQQREWHYSHECDRNSQQQEALSQGKIVINKEMENKTCKKNKQNNEIKATLEGSTRNKEQATEKSDGDYRDNEMKHESSSLLNKNQNQQVDTTRGSSSRFGWVPSNPTAVDAPAPKPTSSSNSRRSSKSEGSNSTTSALSKLTTRLNFLKERKNQIANELQNLDKSNNLEKGKEAESCLSPMDKNQGLEGSSLRYPKDNGSQQLRISDKRISMEKVPSPKSRSLLHQNSDRGKMSEDQQPQQLDRVKSECESSNNANKVQSSKTESKNADISRRSEGLCCNTSKK
ncbi:hypothetical protein Nepgr_002079 [Nepenthes gracilis]|uniref:Rho GTPase-activating protein REN1-like n=1 Tax=Nepenthes gracilis TaxID=150966 RepID=A0AAD3P3E2_NEPGR|nr:hypothetical protein Nepgr_002079 [Nepenthes gracilis]